MTVVEVRPMAFPGVFEVRTAVFHDLRGEFAEAFVRAKFSDATGIDFEVAQANVSVSVLGTVRGIHFSAGQAKYVQCTAGRVLDVVVDLRPGSATFGSWDAVELDAAEHNSVHIPAGFGHAFQALTEGASVFYLCSTPYDPALEGGINPLDEELAITWPLAEMVLSDRDRGGQSLAAYRAALG